MKLTDGGNRRLEIGPHPNKASALEEAALTAKPDAGISDVLAEAVAGLRSKVRKAAQRPIIAAKQSGDERLVYCLALEPDYADTDGEAVSAQEIKQAAHGYMTHSRIIKSMHSTHIRAVPVESYIAPVDFVIEDAARGPQSVKKGSWVLGIRVNDEAEWRKVKDGTYRGISIGGYAARIKP